MNAKRAYLSVVIFYHLEKRKPYRSTSWHSISLYRVDRIQFIFHWIAKNSIDPFRDTLTLWKHYKPVFIFLLDRSTMLEIKSRHRTQSRTKYRIKWYLTISIIAQNSEREINKPIKNLISYNRVYPDGRKRNGSLVVHMMTCIHICLSVFVPMDVMDSAHIWKFVLTGFHDIVLKSMQCAAIVHKHYHDC